MSIHVLHNSSQHRFIIQSMIIFTETYFLISEFPDLNQALIVLRKYLRTGRNNIFFMDPL